MCIRDSLLTYFLYRHFMKALGDDAVQDKVQLALVSTAVIQLLDVYLSLIHIWPRLV